MNFLTLRSALFPQNMRGAVVVSFSLSAIICGCGSKEASTTTATPASTSLTKNSQTSNSAAADSASEAADAVAESGGESATRLSAAGNELLVTNSCTTSAGKSIVGTTYSGSNVTSNSRTSRKGVVSGWSLTTVHTGSVTKTWTPPTGVTLDCATDAKMVKIPWRTATAATLQLDVAIAGRGITRTKVVTVGSAQVTKKSGFLVDGTRQTVWTTATVDVANAQVARSKTVTSNVTRSMTYTDSSGAEIKVAFTVKTKEGAPLAVDVLRSSVTGASVQKTIKSGTIVSTSKETEGGTIESTFKDVVYDLSSTNANKCVPTSGSIAGGVFEKNATVAAKTFVILFNAETDSGISISYDGGAAVDFPEFNPSGCDLERE